MEIICTPRDGKVKHARVFQIALEGVGEKSSVPVRGRDQVKNFGEGRDLFTGWRKSVEERFGTFKPISMLKTKFCKY